MKDLAFGEKTPLDLGFRYPVFAKVSCLKKKSCILRKSCYSPSPWKCQVASLDEPSETSLDSSFSISTCGTFNIVDLRITTCSATDILPGLGCAEACTELKAETCDSISIVENNIDLHIMKELVATLLSCLYEDDNVELLAQPVNHTMKWLKNEVRVLSKAVFDSWMRDFISLHKDN